MLKRRGRLRDLPATLMSIAAVLLPFTATSSATSTLTPNITQEHQARSTHLKHRTDPEPGGLGIFSTTYGRWDHIHLTYGFENGTADIAGEEAEQQAVRDGMKLWADATPVTFSEVASEAAEIRIRWATGSHGDEIVFNPEIFAHSTYIPNGDIHFNDEVRWTTGTTSREGEPVDLVTIAGHEVGHSLGMLHPSCGPFLERCSTAERAALMWYFPHERGSRRALGSDDLSGIQSLYGRNPGRRYLLRNANSAGIPEVVFTHGSRGDLPVAGDWNGDGTDTIGYYRRGTFYLRNSNSSGGADISFAFGNSEGDLPIAGDWNEDRRDTIGVYRPSNGSFYLKDTNASGVADYSFAYGNNEDLPVAGDWNNSGTDTIGLYRPSTGWFYLNNTNANDTPEHSFAYGNGGQGDLPVAGDWDENGYDSVGIVRPTNGVWYLDNEIPGNQPVSYVFPYGNVGPRIPIAGDWNNSGTDTPGTVQD